MSKPRKAQKVKIDLAIARMFQALAYKYYKDFEAIMMRNSQQPLSELMRNVQLAEARAAQWKQADSAKKARQHMGLEE